MVFNLHLLLIRKIFLMIILNCHTQWLYLSYWFSVSDGSFHAWHPSCYQGGKPKRAKVNSLKIVKQSVIKNDAQTLQLI